MQFAGSGAREKISQQNVAGNKFHDQGLQFREARGHGEQLFFFDKQFKNDPKRCKPCKSKRAGAGLAAGSGPAAAGLSRTETRTPCSECGVETTVPFKPTQGRPVLCRQCFQGKRAATSDAPATTAIDSGMASVGEHSAVGAELMSAAQAPHV